VSVESLLGISEPLDEAVLRQLQDLLPSAFPDGELDPAALLEALGLPRDVPAQPSFNFTWPGIEEARQAARAATTTTLVPHREASIEWDTARDVLI
jgi:adenine-specific DNA-methyltransferase